MSRSVDETRRDFLLKLAKTAAFVPPAVLSLDVRPGRAAPQGKGKASVTDGGGKGQGAAVGQTTGSLTPTASAVQAPVNLETQDSKIPWDPGAPGKSAPWTRPPPTQTGR